MYKIAIPSYKREKKISKQTLDTLKRNGIPASKIYIFVNDILEKAVYEEVIDKDLYNEIVSCNTKGIANIRQSINDFFPMDEEVIQIDDDIREFTIYKPGNTKMETLVGLNEFFCDAFINLKVHNKKLWGIYPVNNAFFIKNKKEAVTNGLSFCIGLCYGFITNNQVKLSSELCPIKEDFHNTLQHYKLWGGNIRYETISCKTTFFAPGGCGKERTLRNDISVAYLKDTYPELVTVKIRKKNNMKELLVKKAKKNSIKKARN